MSSGDVEAGKTPGEAFLSQLIVFVGSPESRRFESSEEIR